MDLDIGEPYLNDTNNTVDVDNEYAFKQIINGLFNCQRGSEPLHPMYGFDLYKAIRESAIPKSEMFIKSLVTDALDPRKELTISSVEAIQAERKDDNTMYVQIELTSILGDHTSVENEL